jgi:hypothetical protein
MKRICYASLMNFVEQSLTVAHLLNNYQPFMDPENVLRCSQELAIWPYHEPDESNQHSYTLLFIRLLYS